MCLYSWDFTINHNENENKNEKIDRTDTTLADLGLDMDTNIVNIKSVEVWWCLKQHLSDIWSSIHERDKQTWG